MVIEGMDAYDFARPHALKLLGKRMVAWRDGGGTWRVLQDRCPHRIVPLSGLIQGFRV